MSDNIVRHLVAAMATIVCLLAYTAGYFSGPFGWWWTGIGVSVVYMLMYKIVDAGGGGHH